MSLTPVELRHIRFGRGVLGYRRAAVDRLLVEATQSFEDVWRERADLLDKVEQLEADLVRYRELETLLRQTLVSAERASHDLKDQAQREADRILGEAHAEARAVLRDALAEGERLTAEARRVRALLAAALATVEEVDRGDGRGTELERTEVFDVAEALDAENDEEELTAFPLPDEDELGRTQAFEAA